MKMFRLATVGASYLIHGQKIDRCFRFHAMQCSKYICYQRPREKLSLVKVVLRQLLLGCMASQGTHN